MTGPMPKTWESWYRFARDELGLERDEAIEYANARYVEEQNRARLRGGPLEPAPAAPEPR